MQERHTDRDRYFKEQTRSSAISVFPYIQKHKPLGSGVRVLEIGCGEGGNLYPFLESGCECYGVDLNEFSIENGKTFYSGNSFENNLHLLCENIYDIEPEDLGGTFDVIFLRDVIEHIPNQEKFMKHLKKFMINNGVVFFAFPPWRNPFGGHQQVCDNKYLSKTPYLHLLPMKWYENLLKNRGEGIGTISELLGIRETGISVNRFNKIIAEERYHIVEKTHYLINPNYEIKFGLKPRKVWKLFQIPYLQDFYTTAMYFLIRK